MFAGIETKLVQLNLCKIKRTFLANLNIAVCRVNIDDAHTPSESMAQALALSQGEAADAFVRGKFMALTIDEKAGTTKTAMSLQKFAVAVADKADVLRFFLFGDGRACSCGDGPRIFFAQFAQR